MKSDYQMPSQLKWLNEKSVSTSRSHNNVWQHLFWVEITVIQGIKLKSGRLRLHQPWKKNNNYILWINVGHVEQYIFSTCPMRFARVLVLLVLFLAIWPSVSLKTPNLRFIPEFWVLPKLSHITPLLYQIFVNWLKNVGFYLIYDGELT